MFENVVSAEKIKVIDKNISFFANNSKADEFPVVASVVLKYDNINIALCGQFLDYDDLLKEYISKMTEFNHSVIDMLVNTKLIQQKQNNNKNEDFN